MKYMLRGAARRIRRFLGCSHKWTPWIECDVHSCDIPESWRRYWSRYCESCMASQVTYSEPNSESEADDE